MGKRELVDVFKKIKNTIIEENGPLNLFMLLLDEESQDTYTLVISSKWLDPKTPLEGIKEVAKYLFNELSEEEMPAISSITAVNTQDPYVRSITSNMRVSGGAVSFIQGCIFGGVSIDMCIILESQFIV